MIVYCLAAITVFAALAGCFGLWRAVTIGGPMTWPHLAFCISLLVFIYLYGAWVFLSVFLKYIMVLSSIIILLYGLKKKKTVAIVPGSRPLINLFFTVVFAILSVLYFTGTTGRAHGIARLSLPFRSGTYFVFQGGKGLPTNVFHYSLRGAVFAMDIVKLNKAGNRAVKVFSDRLEDYEIFGDTIYSPCNGTVIKVNDDNEDNIPPERKRGPGNTNQVLIDAGTFYVFMGHLKHGSLLAKAGNKVLVGQPLGCAGNSGFSLEPHLHIQAHAKTGKGIPWYREKPLLMEFDGKSYLLFDMIKASAL